MDQNSTHLPHIKKLPKASVNLTHLRTHLTGVICHGFGAFGYLDYLQYPHDPNLTINILLNVLLTKLSDVPSTGVWPDTLYVQLDNCARENKNQYVLGILALLVELEIFREV